MLPARYLALQIGVDVARIHTERDNALIAVSTSKFPRKDYDPLYLERFSADEVAIRSEMDAQICSVSKETSHPFCYALGRL